MVQLRTLYRTELYVTVVLLATATLLQQTNATDNELTNTNGPNDSKLSDSENKRATWLVSRATRTGSDDSGHFIKPKVSRASWLEMKRNGDVTGGTNYNNGEEVLNGAAQHRINRYRFPKADRNKIQPNRPHMMANQGARNNRASWLQMKRWNTPIFKQQQAKDDVSVDSEDDNSTEVDTDSEHAQSEKSHATSRRKRDTMMVSGFDNNGMLKDAVNDVSFDMEDCEGCGEETVGDVESDAVDYETGEPIQSNIKTPMGHFINGRSSTSLDSGEKIKVIRTRSLFGQNGHHAPSDNRLNQKHLDYKIKESPLAKKATWLNASKRMPTRSEGVGHGFKSSIFSHTGDNEQQKRMPTREMNSFFPYDGFNSGEQSSFERMISPSEDDWFNRRMPTRETDDSYMNTMTNDLEARMPTRSVNYKGLGRYLRMPTREMSQRMPTRTFDDHDTPTWGSSIAKRMPTRGLVSRMPTRTSRAMWLPVRDLY